jgi:DNA primase small subunit
MDEKTLSFLRQVYREHYFKHHDLIELPTEMAAREFGYIPFGGGMVRHLSFKNGGELMAELVKQAPSSVYCSNATYERPTLQMDEKGWLGADLIFDIDADSIPTPCKVKHAWWLCADCHKGGMGAKPSKCPKCRGLAVGQVQWSCQECLNATKEHVRKLTDFLTDDFGVDRRQIHLYFSGNRGYHAQVHDERFQKAAPPIRAEIANYIKGSGLSIRSTPQAKAAGTTPLGWAYRSDLFGARSVSSKRQNQKLVEQVVTANAALIDEAVTTDVHRVFRMPGTLHGSSGLLKMRVESIDAFDPEKNPVVLGNQSAKVYVDFAPEFFLKGMRFGPYDSSTVQIPIYAAVFLLARGLGRISA